MRSKKILVTVLADWWVAHSTTFGFNTSAPQPYIRMDAFVVIDIPFPIVCSHTCGEENEGKKTTCQCDHCEAPLRVHDVCMVRVVSFDSMIIKEMTENWWYIN